MSDFLAGLEQWPLAAALRGSVWLYPLVNAAHITGIALLFGAIVPLDLRLAGFWPAIPMRSLRRVLLPVAACGLLLAVVAGALLFIAKAGDYAASPWFRAKIAVVALALANAAVLELGARKANALWSRLAGIASLGLWLSAIVLGRLVGYF